MDLEVKCGQMALDMKVIGKLIKLTVKVNSFMLMEIYMKVSGTITNAMDMESTQIRKEPDMRDTGRTIPNLDKERKSGLKVANTWANTSTGKSKALASTRGPTAQSIKETG